MTDRNEAKLIDALRTLGAENAAISPPPEIEAKVLSVFARPATPPRKNWLLPVAVTAVAASLAAGALLMHQPAPPLPSSAQAPFIAVPYVAPPAPYERTEVRRMNVPLAALMAAGIKVREANPGGTVQADVLVGQDGRPLAIRLI